MFTFDSTAGVRPGFHCRRSHWRSLPMITQDSTAGVRAGVRGRCSPWTSLPVFVLDLAAGVRPGRYHADQPGLQLLAFALSRCSQKCRFSGFRPKSHAPGSPRMNDINSINSKVPLFSN